jgi:hypothetical protein
VPSVPLTPGDGTDPVLETMFGETPEDGQCPNRRMNKFGAPTRPRPLNPLNAYRIDRKWTRILEKVKAPRSLKKSHTFNETLLILICTWSQPKPQHTTMPRFCNFHFTSNTAHQSTITATFHVFETKIINSKLVGKRGASQSLQHAVLTETTMVLSEILSSTVWRWAETNHCSLNARRHKNIVLNNSYPA